MKTKFSRREVLGAAAGVPALPLVPSQSGQATAPVQAAPKTEPLNRFPRMVQEYFVTKVREVDRQANGARAKLTTRDEAERYVKDVQARIAACFGPLPPKTPLNPRKTGQLDRDTYTVEKIIFESRPGLLVTANLYVPKNRPFPLPGVVGSCGHTDNGKAGETYQAFAQGLARLGYVVLLYDPIGQGERFQYPDAGGKSRIGPGTREHNYMGNQQLLVGESLAMWRTWDGIRALDYLLTRVEVDKKHLGITGNSGGGTITTWLCGLEPRWTMAAPGCFVTTFRRNLENELPADIEQCPPKVLAMGLDHSDFLAAMAPKPIIILAKERDFFDARGAEEAYARLKKLYALLGAEDRIAFSMGPTYHGYSQEIREAMYGWFNKVTGISTQSQEPALKLENEADLLCAPNGQVAAAGSRSAFSFTSQRSKELAAGRGKPDDLRQAVISALNLGQWTSAPEYRILRPLRYRGYPKKFSTTYAIETEPGIHAIVYRLSDETHYSRPLRGKKRAILYVSHQSSDVELREESLLSQLITEEPDSDFYACDVRGIGESRPETCGEKTFLDPYGSDYFYAVHSIMLGRPYLGGKTADVLTVLEWLRSVGYSEIHLAAMGWGALAATFAAVLSDHATTVTLKNALRSYAEVAESEDYKWPLSALVPNILTSLDLPDCYAVLAKKQLRQIEPKGAA